MNRAVGSAIATAILDRRGPPGWWQPIETHRARRAVWRPCCPGTGVNRHRPPLAEGRRAGIRLRAPPHNTARRHSIRCRLARSFRPADLSPCSFRDTISPLNGQPPRPKSFHRARQFPLRTQTLLCAGRFLFPSRQSRAPVGKFPTNRPRPRCPMPFFLPALPDRTGHQANRPAWREGWSRYPTGIRPSGQRRIWGKLKPKRLLVPVRALQFPGICLRLGRPVRRWRAVGYSRQNRTARSPRAHNHNPFWKSNALTPIARCAADIRLTGRCPLISTGFTGLTFGWKSRQTFMVVRMAIKATVFRSDQVY